MAADRVAIVYECDGGRSIWAISNMMVSRRRSNGKSRVKTQGAVPFLVVLLLGMGLHAMPQVALTGSQPPDWWKAENAVVATLMNQKTDIADLVGTVMDVKWKTGQGVMFKLGVLMRAGMTTEAVACVKELKKKCPTLDNHQIEGIYYEACDHLQAWGVAKALVEEYSDQGWGGLALDNRLLAHLLESGWSAAQVDRWLADLPLPKGDMSESRLSAWTPELFPSPWTVRLRDYACGSLRSTGCVTR